MAEINDPLGYLSDIKKALPNALIEQELNFDDIHCGWIIGVAPLNTIIFKFKMGKEQEIVVKAATIPIWQNKFKWRTLFSGTIPANLEGTEPDSTFIIQLLRNYKSIG